MFKNGISLRFKGCGSRDISRRQDPLTSIPLYFLFIAVGYTTGSFRPCSTLFGAIALLMGCRNLLSLAFAGAILFKS